jgi:3-methyladenine DNA glycosylase AlkD
VTTRLGLDVEREVAAIATALEGRRDPLYEWGMRRTVRTDASAHCARLPDIRKVVAEWLRSNRAATAEEVLMLAEALWQTGWREERIVASVIVGKRTDVMQGLDWPVVERWTAAIDNWEHVDNLATALVGPLLVQRPELLVAVKEMAMSDHPWRRRTAIVTLLIAARRVPGLLGELEATAEQLKRDPHPLVRKAVVWARKVASQLAEASPGGGPS